MQKYHHIELVVTLLKKNQIDCLIHVDELTQPQGHSTSGSHERYKSDERLQWEKDFDCNLKFREWIIQSNLGTDDLLKEIENSCKKIVKESQIRAWESYQKPIKDLKNELLLILNKILVASNSDVSLKIWIDNLKDKKEFKFKEILQIAKKTKRKFRKTRTQDLLSLKNWIKNINDELEPKFSSHLYSQQNLKVIILNLFLQNIMTIM